MTTVSSLSEIRHLDVEQMFVSFDVFDTLVYRRYLQVNEVHDLVSAFALSLFGRFGQENPGDLTLTRYAASEALKCAPHARVEEPTLVAVWTRLVSARLGPGARAEEIAQRIADFEYEIDRQNLYAIDGAAEMLVALRNAGKTLVAISDMYFSGEQVKGILQSAGLLQYFDHVFVSADENLTKYSGNLFSHVWKTLGVVADDVVHAGDNPHSDVAMPLSLGAQAIHIAHAPLLKIERPAYGRRPDIHLEIGDLCKLFLVQLMFHAQSAGTDKLFFLSRDGCLLHKVLRQWNTVFLREFFLPVEAEDLFLSRATTCWLSINFQGKWLLQAIGYAFWLHHGKATPRQISTMLGIDRVPPALEEDRIYASAVDTFTVLDAYAEAGLSADIKTALLEKRAMVRAYLKDAGFFDHRSVHLSDVGYSGTVVRDLNIFLLQESEDAEASAIPTIHFHCIATNSNYAANARAALPHVLFQNDVILADHAIPDTLKQSFAWLEMFFKHPVYGPLLGFVEQDGRTVPSYEVAPKELANHPSHQILEAVHADPSDIVLFWMVAVRFWAQFTDPLLDRFLHPDTATIEQMLLDIYEVDAVSGQTRSVVLIAPDLSEEEIHQRARAEDYWIPGSQAASRHARIAARPGRENTLTPRLDAIILDRLNAQQTADAAGFDPVFYRRFYRDLSALPNNQALEAHFLTHGRLVGRYGSEAEMRTHYAQLAQTLPEGFDAGAYFMVNRDLAVLEPLAWRAAQHYLQLGKAEHRAWHHDLGPIDAQFETLVLDEVVRLSPMEQSQHERGVPARVILLRRFEATTGPWLSMIDLQEFNALNFDWSEPKNSVAEAAIALLEHGLERIAPLSLAASFDPDFYRRQYIDVADLSDQDAYRHWLFVGTIKGREPSEEAALQSLIGQRNYPEAFRWDILQDRSADRLRGATRLDLLREFLESPESAWAGLLDDYGSGEIWCALSQRAAARGDSHAALSALLAATRAEPERGMLWHALGDFHQGRGDRHAALAAYTASLATTTPNRWSYINCVRICAEIGTFENGLRFLKEARPVWKDMQPWREARHMLFQRWFDDQAGRCYEPIMASDLRARSHPDTRFQRFMEAFVPAMHAVGPVGDLRLTRGDGPVLILCGAVVSERTRWEASLRAANKHGQRVIVFSREQVDLFTESLPGASIAILHEVEIDSLVLDTLLSARATGIRTLFWVGPLGRVDDPAIPDLGDLAWSDFLLGRDGREVGTTLRSIYAATLCDDVVLTTPSLTSRLRDLGITPYCGEAAAICAITQERTLLQDQPRQRRTVACFMTGRPLTADKSGMLAYEAAVGQAALFEQIETAMLADPAIFLLVEGADGELDVPLALRNRVELCPDWLTFDARLAMLAHCDLALDLRHAPRDQRAIADDAAWFGIPTLALADTTTAQGHANIVEPDELGRHITSFLNDPKLCRNRGEAAWRALREGFATRTRPMTTATQADVARAAVGKRRPRILLANLFAPPQTVGGATRVLADNLADMLELGGEDIEFSVLASDDENSRRGATRLDSWKGVPVFRIATPQELDMDWRTYNSEVETYARRVIELIRPDLVHIHCLPRLSVAVAEACRALGVAYIITLHDAWWISDFPFLVQEDGQPANVAVDPARQSYSRRIGFGRSMERAARMRAALRHAARLVSVSEEFATIYRDAGFDVLTIANGVSVLTPAPRTCSTGPVRLLHVGGLEHHKGAYLIEAALRARKFSNLTLTILDHSRDPGAPLQTIWGATTVTIRGRVPADKIAGLYGQADVLLAPSTWPESFGLVSREAAICGLWVIANNQGAMGSDVVESKTGFVVDTTSPAALVRVLEAIDIDPARYLQSPPSPDAAPRRAVDQARDILALYRTLIEAV